MNWILLLRGVNVSGKNLLKMKDFAKCLSESGLQNVKYYLQSGNITFSCEKDVTFLQASITSLLKAKFKISTSLIFIQEDELVACLSKFPWPVADYSKAFVVCCDRQPDPDKLQTLRSLIQGDEKFEMAPLGLYLSTPLGYGNTKFNNNFFEKKLNLNATTRNLKTLANLCQQSNKLPVFIQSLHKSKLL